VYIFNRLGVDHQCDIQTDGQMDARTAKQTDRITIAIAWVWRCALKMRVRVIF